VLGVSCSLEASRFTRMPLSPAFIGDFCVEFAVQKYHGRVTPPGTAKKNYAHARIGRHTTLIEDISAHLLRIFLTLSGEHYFTVGNCVNHAAIECHPRISEDEIDVALDIAVREVLSRRHTWAGLRLAGAGTEVERVLRTQ